MKLSSNKYIMQPSKVTWVLTANRTGAVIFRKVKGEKHLEFLERFDNPSGRLREQLLVSDSPGKAKSGKGSRHALGIERVWHEQAAIRFAKKMVRFVETAKQNGKYDNLILIAEPHFLGLLRKAFSKKFEKVERREIPREIKFIDTKRVEKRVNQLLKSEPVGRAA